MTTVPPIRTVKPVKGKDVYALREVILTEDLHAGEKVSDLEGRGFQ